MGRRILLYDFVEKLIEDLFVFWCMHVGDLRFKRFNPSLSQFQMLSPPLHSSICLINPTVCMNAYIYIYICHEIVPEGLMIIIIHSTVVMVDCHGQDHAALMRACFVVLDVPDIMGK
jgi:hypothetical protein